MIPAYQTRTGPVNDSFRACLASVLELPLKQIPDYQYAFPETWVNKFNDWLIARLHLAVIVSDHDVKIPGSQFDTIYHLQALRCTMNTKYKDVPDKQYVRYVVMKGGKVVHDPHPLDEHPMYDVTVPFGGACFVMINPARATRINRVLALRGWREDDPPEYTVRDLGDLEKAEIMYAVNVCKTQAEAAKRLGIGARTLQFKLKKYRDGG